MDGQTSYSRVRVTAAGFACDDEPEVPWRALRVVRLAAPGLLAVVTADGRTRQVRVPSGAASDSLRQFLEAATAQRDAWPPPRLDEPHPARAQPAPRSDRGDWRPAALGCGVLLGAGLLLPGVTAFVVLCLLLLPVAGVLCVSLLTARLRALSEPDVLPAAAPHAAAGSLRVRREGLSIRAERSGARLVPWAEIESLWQRGPEVKVVRRGEEPFLVAASGGDAATVALVQRWLADRPRIAVTAEELVPPSALSRAQAPDADAERGLSVTGG